MGSNPLDSSESRLARQALALGLTAQVAQVLVFREFLAQLHGTELVFGLILACGLAWTALGSAVAGRWPGHFAAGGRGLSWIAYLSAIWGVLLIGQLLTIRWWSSPAEGAVGSEQTPEHAALGILLLTGPSAFLSGLQFVLVLRQLPGSAFGALYRAESIGAVAGGLAFTFLLAGHGSPVTWAACLGAVCPLAVLAAGLSGAGIARALMACVAVVYVALALLGPHLDQHTTQALWKKRLPGHVLEEVRETPYARLTVLQKLSKKGAQLALFMDATLTVTHERNATVSDTRALADLCACIHPAPERVLLLGGTLSRFPMELLNHGVRTLDAVETDPALMDLAREHGVLLGERGINRIAADGRYFVKRSPASTYDLVIASPGLPETSVSNRFCTAEFFHEVRRILNDRGVVVLLLPAYGAGVEYQGTELTQRTACIWRAMREAFREVRAVPLDGHVLAGGNQPGALQLSPSVLGARIDSRENARPHMWIAREDRVVPGQDYFSSIFSGVLNVQPQLDGEDRQKWVAQLETALEQADVMANRDERPTAVAESLSLGMTVARGGTSWSSVLRLAAPITLIVVLLTTVALAAPCWLRPRRQPMPGHDRLALLLCAAGTGLFGMAVEVLLLHAYQNVRGYVYGEIGALIACFMAGLALGAQAGAKTEARWRNAEPSHERPRTRRALIACVLTGVALSVLLPLLIRGVSGFPQPLLAAGCFWTLMFAAGAVDGFTFPLLVALAPRPVPEADVRERFGGQVYAADLLGAAVGAVVCGAIWLPAFGLGGACLAVAGALTLSGLGLLRQS